MPQHHVFVIPGFLGTRLNDCEGKRLWFSPRLLFGRMDDLAMTESGIQIGKLIPFIYRRMIQRLRWDHDVFPFPTDWRMPIKTEGKRLAAFAETIIKNSDRPITILENDSSFRRFQFDIDVAIIK